MHIVNFFVYFLITFLPVIVSSWAILFFVDAFLYECVFGCFLEQVLFVCFRGCLRGRVSVFFLGCFRFFFYKFPALCLKKEHLPTPCQPVCRHSWPGCQTRQQAWQDPNIMIFRSKASPQLTSCLTSVPINRKKTFNYLYSHFFLFRLLEVLSGNFLCLNLISGHFLSHFSFY